MKASPFNHRKLLAQVAAVSATVLMGMALATVSGAQASTCSFSNGVLDLNLTSGASGTTIETAGGTIAISEGKPVTCVGGTPTTTNTEVVRVIDVLPDGNSQLVVRDPQSFAPGMTPEATGQGEVEFVVNMGAGDDKLVALGGPTRAADWTAGSYGFNWTADADADLIGAFDTVALVGGERNDQISAHGGRGTADPLDGPRVEIDGLAGDDALYGSASFDSLDGGPGDDQLAGLEGDDVLSGGSGNDGFEGGPGRDTAAYIGHPSGISVDLNRTDQQDTGTDLESFVGIENLYGTSLDDTLIGDASANVLKAEAGNDTLDGRGGSDTLDGRDGSDTVTFATAPGAVTADLAAGTAAQGADGDKLELVENLIGSPFADTLTGDDAANRVVGGDGADTVSARGGADRVELRDGLADQASCGDGADSVIGDRIGVDSLAADCESLDLLPEPEQPQPEQPQVGGETPGTLDRQLSFTLGATRRQRVLRQKAVRVRIQCPLEACTTTVRASVTLPQRQGGAGAVRRLRLRAVTAAVTAGSSRTLVLRLTRKQLAAIRRALVARRSPTLDVRAEARDAAGNRVVRTLRVTVRS